jgi:UDP-glucuronate decarboxylase
MILLPSDLSNLGPLLLESHSSLDHKTVLLTGSSGLIGSYLLQALVSVGEHEDLHLNLILTARRQSFPLLASRNNIHISYFYCDYDDPLSVASLADKYAFSVDIIFHCGSPSYPKAYADQPFTTFSANTTFLHSLLQTLNHTNSGSPPRFFFFSTTGVYGKHPTHHYPLNESSQCHVIPTDLNSIYNVSKIAGEQILSHAAHINGMSLHILRLNINYGPGINLNDGRALSDFLKDARSGRDIRLRSLGTQTRNYLYLSDTISAILMLLNRVVASCTVNISHHVDTSIFELASVIAQIYGVKAILPDRPESHAGVDFELTSVDCTQLYRLTGWRPTVSLQDGLARLIGSLDAS